MARGYPDFYGFSTVPKYGIPITDADFRDIPSVVGYIPVLTATGKGRSYSGYILAHGTDDLFNGFRVRFVVDGVTFGAYNAFYTLIWNWHAHWENLLNLSCAEVFDFGERVCFVVAPDWTWGQTCTFEVQNTSGANISVQSELLWGKMI